MFKLSFRGVLLASLAGLGAVAALAQAPRFSIDPVSDEIAPPPADEGYHLMRVADVHEDQIVFTYENDLWLVPSTGGAARRITNDPGSEVYAKFSPDGSLIAFTAQYDGGIDVYVMPSEGGRPTRLTYHPSADRVLGWMPDGRSVLFRSNRLAPRRGEEVYTVSLDGGLPTKLPVDRAGLSTISPDGKRIAYNRISRESNTWKRHRGGTAQDIWMGDLEEQAYKKIIDTDWSDNYPMWHGEAIYFVSDREDGTLNIYKHDLESGEDTRVTQYADYDVKYPSMGPNHIVFQYQETLHLLDLNTHEISAVEVRIPSDMIRLREEFVGVSPSQGSFNLSPSGVRALVEARGEILNLPVKDGQPINLTKSSGSREKNAAWSPDGRWIAFLSDKTGEEEIYLVDQKGEGEWKQLTTGGYGFRMHLVWSPDSKHLIFSDKFMRLNLVDAESGEITVIDQSDYDDAWERWGVQEYVWSPCGQWVAYTKMEESQYEGIFLYSLAEKQSYRVTSDQYSDWSPSFSPDGTYLYFLSDRTFNPIMGHADQNHVFLDMTRAYIVLLQADGANPFAPKDSAEEIEEDESASDEADDAEEEAADADDEAEGESENADKATVIDIDGLDRRVVIVGGVPAGQYYRLEAVDGGFMYLKRDGYVFSKYDVVNDGTGERLDLYSYDLKDDSTKKVLGGVCNYHQSADGKKMIYRAGSVYGVVDVGSSASVGDGKLDLGAVRVKIDRMKEFMQAFNEAWRIERDWFYDANMHGHDWSAIHDKYAVFVPYCGTRSDLNYLIGEMIAELNIGHTYVGGGDIAYEAKSVSTGLLGADLVAEAGSDYYRFAHIVPNNPGVPAERSPLDEPGCPIERGDYLIAVDGEPVTTADNPYLHLQNKRDSVVTLTYNDAPSVVGAETCRVRTIGSENAVRYREWVENNRRYVADKTNGDLGYVHVPDMGEGGLIEFAKSWYSHYYKKGFIIDVRYNGGGFTGDMIIDRLERRIWGLTQPREGKVLRDPERIFYGPFAVLINEDTGSNGEMFAEAIKLRGLGPIIGARTWGGSIGMEPHQNLIDGGTVTPPQFGLYDMTGRWVIEGRGVEPHFEIQNMPGDVLRGVDAQLDKAIDLITTQLESYPPRWPTPPEYPDKSRPRGS